MEDVASGNLSPGAGVDPHTFNPGFFTVVALGEGRQAPNLLVTASETQTNGPGDADYAGSRTLFVGVAGIVARGPLGLRRRR